MSTGIKIMLAFLPVAAFLAGMGCCALLFRPRNRTRSLDKAYEEGRADEKALWEADNAPDWDRIGSELAEGPAWEQDDRPLVPLPARLPDADTLTGMYAQLGDQEKDAGVPVDSIPAGHRGFDGLGGPLTATVDPAPAQITTWDAAEPAERVPTIAELATDAEYRLFWAELAAMRESARDWYDREFSTGAFKAVVG